MRRDNGRRWTLICVLLGSALFAAAFAEKPRERGATPRRERARGERATALPAAAAPRGRLVSVGYRRPPPSFATLERFASEAAFRAYLAALKRLRHVGNAGVLGLLGSSSGSSIASIFGKDSALGGEAQVALGDLIGNSIGASYGVGGLGLVGTGRGGGGLGGGKPRAIGITNNQEAQVDEGDIVKATEELLIVLRRGRLFTIRHGHGGLVPASRCDVQPPGARWESWYDEMLLHGDRVVVIGYSYHHAATELGLFRLVAGGTIRHEATYLVRSGDYYSSRNYASRLIGDRLVLYTPGHFDPSSLRLPEVARWDAARRRLESWRPLLAGVQIYRPVQATSWPTLHTIISCDLSRPSLRCGGHALLAPSARTFYVSRGAVYLWVGPRAAEDERQAQPSFVYRLPLVRGGAEAVLARGGPIDQLSFQETERELRVLLRPQAHGDAMWQPERGGGPLALLRLPLRAFSATPRAPRDARYRELPAARSGSLQNRFVGDWLLYGAGSGWLRSRCNGGELTAVHLGETLTVRTIPLDHGVDRIEPAGAHAVAVGSGDADLFFTSIALGRDPGMRFTHVQRGAAQGETRTHGFFFLPDGEGGGMLGLPVRGGAPYRQLVHGSASVLYLRLAPDLRFHRLGALAARDRVAADRCKVSCVDWYGNARPIFLPGRVLALLGYELVEGQLGTPGLLRERRRVTFLQPGSR
jgi:hypothetical protein